MVSWVQIWWKPLHGKRERDMWKWFPQVRAVKWDHTPKTTPILGRHAPKPTPLADHLLCNSSFLLAYSGQQCSISACRIDVHMKKEKQRKSKKLAQAGSGVVHTNALWEKPLLCITLPHRSAICLAVSSFSLRNSSTSLWLQNTTEQLS